MDTHESDRDRAIAEFSEERGAYLVRYARSSDDRVEVQRLRFEVFARELGATVSGAEQELDVDPLDERVDHLLVVDKRTGDCVGTYRLATCEHVGSDPGFYSRRIFVMDHLDPQIEAQGVELGRACIAIRHRNRGVFQLLLRGIGAYLVFARKRYLFGCGSVLLKDPSEALYVHEQVTREGWLDPSLDVAPTDAYRLPPTACQLGVGPALPPLLHAYCAMGAGLGPRPAYDPDFSSLDYFVLLDRERMNPRSRSRYCRVER